MGVRRKTTRGNVDLSMLLGPLELVSPLVTAAGTFGLSDEYLRGIDVSKIGAFTTKSLSVFAWPGNPPPRICRSPAGMINSIGLENPGVDVWIRECLPRIKRYGVPVIASVWGRTPEEFSEAACRLGSEARVVAIEVNLSCPNLDAPDQMFAHDPSSAALVVSAVKEAVSSIGIPVLAKLSPNLPSLVELARTSINAGATGLTLTNTVIATSIDIDRKSVVFPNKRGGLSGPAIKPIVLRHVLEVASELPGVPIVGTGGVFNGCDAVEMLMAGASAVGVGTASFYDPRAPVKIAEELEKWCLMNDVHSVRDLIGIAQDSGSRSLKDPKTL